MGSHMRESGLRSPYDKVGGLLYFGRMLDKIRSHAKGELPLEYEVNLGKGFDEKCLTFLRVRSSNRLRESGPHGGGDFRVVFWNGTPADRG